MYRVLYVDDEESLLELAKIFLEQSGEFTVDTLTTVPDAIEKVRVTLYDAIISDYQMPDMNGIAFLKEVRSASGTIPFILFTGKGREEVVIEAINNGVDFYIQKGGDPKSQFAELSHKIRQAVGRRRSEIALSDSERRFADIINFLPDATFAIDMDGYVIAWNRAIEEMTGVPAHEVIGKGNYAYAVPFYGDRRPILIDLISEPDEKIARHYVNIRREGNALSAETSLTLPKGRRIAVLAKASPLFNSDGEVTGAIEAIRDITDWKRVLEDLRAANEQLAASEKELRAQYTELAQNEQKARDNDSRLRYMIGFYDRAGKAQKDLLNYAVEGAGVVTGSPLGYLAFLSEDESELAMYAWSKSAMTECSLQEKPIMYKTEKTGLWGEAVRQRRPIITNDYAAPNPAKKGYPTGHPVITRHMNIPVIEEGHIVLVAGVANKPADYTEDDVYQLSLLMQSLWLVLKRRRSEEALLEREIKFRTLFNNANDAIYIHEVLQDNLPGRFLEVNDTLCSRLGYPREELLTMGVSDIVSDAHRQRMGEISNELARSGLHTFYAEHRKRDGSVFPVEINSRRFTFSGREVVLAATRDITERKRAEDALRESERKYHSLLDQMPELILIHSKGIVRYTNPAAMGTLTYSPEEVLGRPIADFVAPKYHDRIKAAVLRREHGETVEPYDIEIIAKNGSRRTVIISGSPIEFEGVPASLILLTDITERKRMEQALHDSEEKFRSIFNNVRDAIQIIEISKDGVPGKYLEINDVGCRMLQYSREELQKKSPVEISAGYSRPLEKIGREIITTGHSTFEAGYRRKDGSVLPVEISAHVAEIGGKKVVVSVVRDISERKKADEALSASEERFRAIFASQQNGIMIIDPNDHRIVDVNPYFSNLVGLSKEQLTGKVCHRFVCPTQAGKCPITDLGQRVDNAERVLISGDGRVIPVLKTVIPITLGGKDYLIENVHDITERKRAEEAIRLANQKLNLLSGVTRHDIKNQLLVMKGYLELSKNSPGDPAKMAEYIAKEKQAADAIEEQINFTKEYEDLGVNSPVWQDMEKSIALAARELDLAGIEMGVFGLENVEIYADPLFQKAVFNLIDNSLRHGGTAMTKILISSRESKNGIVISCEDDGAGVPARDKKRIFDRGYGKNTGFGLFFIREILAITGITIKETGEPGKGARFEIAVPKGAYRFTENPAAPHRKHRAKG